MVGMIGFASLLIYRIICYFQTLKMNMLIGGIFLGIVITASGLSFLMMHWLYRHTTDKSALQVNPW